MTDYALPRLNSRIYPLLVAAGWMALAAPSCLGQAGAAATTASSSPVDVPYVPTMTFDVASVRESKLDPNLPHRVGGRFQPHSTSLELENVQLYWLITMAYGVELHQVKGIPDWGWTSFNIEAKSDSEADERLAKLNDKNAALEQQHMLQALLADRFNLKDHWTTEEGKVYHLVVTKGGAKLLPAGSMAPDAEEAKWLGDHPAPAFHRLGDSQHGFTYYCHSCGMGDLARLLGAQTGKDVLDQTGITGKFDFRLHYSGRTADDNSENNPMKWPQMIDAVQDQLGLKLETVNGEAKMLVIDHVERPSEN
jgi:uncharacterized protein (TIGR03435 family)